MIQTERILIRNNDVVHTWSDEGRYIVYDGISYEDAWEAYGYERTYTEGDFINYSNEELLRPEEVLEILFGRTEFTSGEAFRLRKKLEEAAISLSDNSALMAAEIFPEWEWGSSYSVGDRIKYDNKLYKVVQQHVSQTSWEPPMVPALFTPVAFPGEIPVWVQPTGAQDAYQTGDKVWYPNKQGSIYISIVDNNVWQPGVYGWDLV